MATTRDIPYDISSRLNRLGERMKELNQQLLTIERLGWRPIAVTSFTLGDIDVTQLAIHGIILVTDKARDFIFDADVFKVWHPSVPREKDLFTWGSRQYEPFSIGDEIFTYTTSSRKRIRVHTKQVAG